MVVCIGYRCADFHFSESIRITFKYSNSTFNVHIGMCNDIPNLTISSSYTEIYSRVEHLDQFWKLEADFVD